MIVRRLHHKVIIGTSGTLRPKIEHAPSLVRLVLRLLRIACHDVGGDLLEALAQILAQPSLMQRTLT